MPTAIIAVGIAILFGLLFPFLPEGTPLRIVLGPVVILVGLYRFIAARLPNDAGERRYGGNTFRPWEKDSQNTDNDHTP